MTETPDWKDKIDFNSWRTLRGSEGVFHVTAVTPDYVAGVIYAPLMRTPIAATYRTEDSFTAEIGGPAPEVKGVAFEIIRETRLAA